METAKQFAERILALPPDQQELPLFVCDSRTGIYERLDGGVRLAIVSGNETGGGDILEMKPGDKYICTSVG